MKLKITFLKKKYYQQKIASNNCKIFEKNFKKRLKKVAKYQTKYYNKNYKSKKFVVDELILLLIKNFNQKRSNKKMFFKFAKSFKIKNKIKK